MQLPVHLVSAIVRAIHVLHECGRQDSAESLVHAVEQCQSVTQAEYNSTDRREYQKRWAREKRRQPVDSLSTVVDSKSVDRLSTKKGSPDLSKREEKREPLEIREISAELEPSEKSGSSVRLSTVVDSLSTVSTVDKSTPELALWRLIFESWRKHAHDGKRCGDPSRFKNDFESVANDSQSRDPRDPAGFADQVIARYVAQKREKGLELQPRFLAADFAAAADHRNGNGNGSKPKPAVLIEYEAAKAAYAAAKKSGDKAAIKQWDSKLENIGKRMTGHA